MISIILTGSTKIERSKEIDKICNNNYISKFDRSEIIPLKKTKTIGIEEIRIAKESIYMTPVRGQTKAVIFNAEEFTTEAQNSLLKLLEEPPNNTIIFLSLPSILNLLPTIISRCQIIKTQLSEKEPVNNSDFIKTLELKIGERFTVAEKFGKDKNIALSYLKDTITQLSQDLHIEVLKDNKQLISLQKYHGILLKLNTTYKTISTTNISPRFAIEILLLSLKTQ